jgi:DNA invertase Pin-like site-specific DNA recombinase
MTRYAAYIRKSTEEQSDEHQREDLREWFEKEDIELSDVDFYAETGSGASEDRDEFQQLIEDVEAGEIENVVIWEVSRIARKGFLAQRFFDACEDSDTTIHVTNGSVRKIEPDGTGRLVADIIASVAAEERRNLIRRTKSGQKRAREAGKWVGNPPVGFVTQDGFLKPNLDPDYDAGETGYFDVVEALESIEAGQSYNKTAKETPNLTRQTLSNIHQDADRIQWYTEQEAEDNRVAEAVEDL